MTGEQKTLGISLGLFFGLIGYSIGGLEGGFLGFCAGALLISFIVDKKTPTDNTPPDKPHPKPPTLHGFKD